MDTLIEKLASGDHRLVAFQYKSSNELKEALDRGYVLLKFPDTQGGTEVGVKVDRQRSSVSASDFLEANGKLRITGTLVLNYNEIELSALIDLATRCGEGSIRVVADELAWHAKRSMND